MEELAVKCNNVITVVLVVFNCYQNFVTVQCGLIKLLRKQ